MAMNDTFWNDVLVILSDVFSIFYFSSFHSRNLMIMNHLILKSDDLSSSSFDLFDDRPASIYRLLSEVLNYRCTGLLISLLAVPSVDLWSDAFCDPSSHRAY